MRGRYWSDDAAKTFAAQFDDGVYSSAFRDRVADALIRGWPPNRDKPLWSLVYTTAALADGARLAGRTREADGFLALRPDTPALSAFLRQLADARPDHATPHEGAIMLTLPDGRLKVDRHRLHVLRKITEFLCAAEEGALAGDVLSILRDVAAAGLSDGALLRERSNTLARLFYAYRAKHFVEGRANSAFDLVRRVMAAADHRDVHDADLLAVWDAGVESGLLRTYRAAVTAAVAFMAERDELLSRRSVEGAASYDEPARQNTIGAAVEAAHALSADAGETGTLDLEAIGASSMRFFTKQELSAIGLYLSALAGVERLPRTLARLQAFHPIQSGLSTYLRKGIGAPIAARVTCEEAMGYLAQMDMTDALAAKTQMWLDAAAALLVPPADDGVVSFAQARGERMLARSRAKGLQRPRAVLAEEMRDSVQALTALAAQLAAVRGALGAIPAPDAAFCEDRALFSERFSAIYLNAEADDDGL
ncbi:MAG: hypothetical protein AAF318_04120 [Pseudomonadota bacterium]